MVLLLLSPGTPPPERKVNQVHPTLLWLMLLLESSNLLVSWKPELAVAANLQPEFACAAQFLLIKLSYLIVAESV